MVLARPTPSSSRVKRSAPEEDSARRPSKKANVAGAKSTHYSVNKHLLASLGGGWTNMPPFAGDEDRLYRWMAEPALWARVIMGDLEPRTQQRLVGLHAALHDGLDASGFVLWRTMPPLREGLTVTLHTAASPIAPQRITLPRVTLRQSKLAPSSRFGAGWEVRSCAGAPSCRVQCSTACHICCMQM